MDFAHDAAGGHVGAALRLERAGPAVAEAGVVADRVICADAAGRRQHLAGRASVDVTHLVEGEVGS